MNEPEIITPTAFRNIITRNLPKTGQTIMYAAGDDGGHEAGWWRGKLNSNNRTRFLIKTISGHEIVLDRATGLMWPRDYNSAGCNAGGSCNWFTALTYLNGLTFAGFSDWRLPNIQELISLLDFEKAAPWIWDPFIWFPPDQTADYWFWTSTTNHRDTTRTFAVHFGLLMIRESLLKTGSYKLIGVRKGL